MPNPIKPKRSYTPSSQPTAADLQPHELAVNWNDGKLFTKNASGNIVSWALGGGGGGSGLSWVSPPASATASGTAGQIAYDGSYVYVCTATNTWTRSPISGWDGSFASVALLMHCDGSGSTFIDSSSSPKTITANGTVTQSATQSKFGGKAAYFDSASGSYLSVTSSDLAPSGDFTIEGWAWLDSTAPQYAGILTSVTAGTNPGGIIIASDKAFLSANSFGDGNEISWTFPTNAWTHFALVNDGGTLRAYLGGVQQGSTAKTITLSATTAYIGSRFLNLQAYNWKGYLDDLRITVGVCRYPGGTTFTPPTGAFPNA